ncbi:barstar family protein [Streptomyces sp. SID5606]|uniref:barstar family protein n=1 Tax=Streptomyces sp. SID5606 TaxID=2690305 RepID=UPI0031F98CF3
MDEPGIHQSFAEALRFPGYYGNNWDALVDCLDDLCAEVTGGSGIVGVIQAADRFLDADHFPLLVSVLRQGAERANSSLDLDGFPLDRPAIAEHFVFEFRAFDPGRGVRLVEQPDLILTQGGRLRRRGARSRGMALRVGPPRRPRPAPAPTNSSPALD